MRQSPGLPSALHSQARRAPASGARALGQVPWQRGGRHRACRINTHPLYTSHCLSGIAAQSLFLNSLLYYTGHEIAAACLLPDLACCSPTHPREQAVPHTACGAPSDTAGCRMGMTSLVSSGSGTANRGAWLHLCCWEPALAQGCCCRMFCPTVSVGCQFCSGPAV